MMCELRGGASERVMRGGGGGGRALACGLPVHLYLRGLDAAHSVGRAHPLQPRSGRVHVDQAKGGGEGG